MVQTICSTTEVSMLHLIHILCLVAGCILIAAVAAYADPIAVALCLVAFLWTVCIAAVAAYGGTMQNDDDNKEDNKEDHKKDRQTDRETDRQRDRQTDRS